MIRKTTYNNAERPFLPSSIAGLGRVFLFLIMLMMGVGSAWAM